MLPGRGFPTAAPPLLGYWRDVSRKHRCNAAELAVNRWNIPAWLEHEVLARDEACVYCGIDFSLPTTARGTKPSWEHIINDATVITRHNIARCCMSCNASKGAKELRAWLASDYCRRKGITEGAVAKVVREALSSSPSHESA